tara:strand:+ start:49 stop:285 length:237 start_codon:yes stop_codon:yes gene_type:complete
MTSERDHKIVVQLFRHAEQSVIVDTDYREFTESEDFVNKVLKEALDKAEKLPDHRWKTEEVELDITAIIHHKDGVVIA